MAKKSRSSRTTSKSTPTFAGIQRGTTTEFSPDYTNVKKDLKRIAVLAVSFFALMIALSFILPSFLR
jgi:hypothetical protein